VSATSELLAWVAGLPGWQRDLLARLAEVTDLSAEAVAEVRANLLHASGGPASTHPLRVPPPELFDAVEPAPERRRIAALGGLENVNAIAPDSHLEFAAGGLTVLYGENAVGKSGYCRVFKRLGRSADPVAEILRDVFGPGGEGPQSVTVEVLGADGRSKPHRLDLAAPDPTALPLISVFDADGAENYVTRTNTIAFTPASLLIFDRLVRAQIALRTGLQEEIAALRSTAVDLAEFDTDTAVGRLLASLNAETDPERLRAAATVTATDRRRISELGALQGPDPAELARRATRAEVEARSARALAEALRALRGATSDEFAGRLAVARLLAERKSAAAATARELAFAGQPIAAVGEPVWQELWEAARRFYEHAAAGSLPFPPRTHGELCPLCLQELSPRAVQRFVSFEEFVKSTTAAEAAAAQSAYAAELARLDPALLDPARPEFLDSLGSYDATLAIAVKAFVDAAELRLGQLRTQPPPVLAPLPAVPLAELESFAEARDAHAAELRDDGALRAAAAELAELEAAVQLAGRLDAILAWQTKLAQIAVLEAALTALKTNAISATQRRIAQGVVTDELSRALGEELRGLGVEEVEIDIDPSGELGNTVVKLCFPSAPSDPSLGEVLSKGEQRAAALAFFFAELGAGSGGGPIVLDDPVSSLDDPHRGRVAERLLAEARRRQVIVFTHDLVFFVALDRGAEEDPGLPYGVQQIWRAGDQIGLSSPDAPWPGQGVKKRIAHLRGRLQEFPRTEEIGPEPYRRAVKGWYEELRESWERAVEEVLFNDVVQRFRAGVQTQRLARAPDLTPERRAAVVAGVERCSLFTHDEAPAAERSKQRMTEDLEALVAFVEAIRKPAQT
jgi:energy-coupling factor transporter ATP-binding protein EcfA2